MKKKGFTLIELIVVIAILAILVLLVLPNVLGLFNQAKEKSFVNELKEIYRAAQTKYAVDSVQGTRVQEYARNSEEECDNTLKLTGRADLDFLIRYDENGNVVLFRASDGSYQYDYSGPGLDIENITSAVDISDISDSQIIKMTCDSDPGTTYYTSSTHVKRENQMRGFMTMYNNFNEFKSSTNDNVYMKYKIENYNPQNVTNWCIVKDGYNSCDYDGVYDTEEECNVYKQSGETCTSKDGKYFEGAVNSYKVGYILNGKNYSIKFKSESDATNAKEALLDSFGKDNCSTPREYRLESKLPDKTKFISKLFGISEVKAAAPAEAVYSPTPILYCSYGNVEAMLLNYGIIVQSRAKSCYISASENMIGCGKIEYELSYLFSQLSRYSSGYEPRR